MLGVCRLFSLHWGLAGISFAGRQKYQIAEVISVSMSKNLKPDQPGRLLTAWITLSERWRESNVVWICYLSGNQQITRTFYHFCFLPLSLSLSPSSSSLIFFFKRMLSIKLPVISQLTSILQILHRVSVYHCVHLLLQIIVCFIPPFKNTHFCATKSNDSPIDVHSSFCFALNNHLPSKQ